MNRWLYLGHRWLGLGLGALVTLWFLSAFVMIYVGFPSQTRTERLAGLSSLPRDSWKILPMRAVTLAGMSNGTAQVRLGEVLGRPVYHFRSPQGGPWVSVYADNGQLLSALTEGEAVAVAQRFAHSQIPAQADGLQDYDQWTVPNSLNPFRPLYRVRVGDQKGTELYVSARTGEVLRDTDRRERVLNYFGAVTHWIYPTWLRRHNELWRMTLRILSGVAMLLPLTGLVLGLRRLMVAWNSFTGVRRWHVLGGLAFGVFMLSWIFSGFLSLRVEGIFDTGEPTLAQSEAFAGGRLRLATVLRSPSEALAQIPGDSVKEGELIQFAGQPYYLLGSASGQTYVVPANGKGQVRTLFPKEALRESAASMLSGGQLLAFEQVSAYDAHYYSRRPGEDPRPLPVWRARFDDLAETWFHVDPRTGQVIERLTRSSRTYRWLFNGLHSFDWPWLATHRPLWDVVVITLLLGGLGTSLIGLQLGWRRLFPVRPE